MTEYKAIKRVRIGEKDYHPGQTFEEVNDGRNWNLIERLGLIVKISDGDISESPKEPLTNPVKSGIVTRKAEIREEGKGWLKVYDEKGQQIGKATRDEEEAELIKLEYETQPE